MRVRGRKSLTKRERHLNALADSGALQRYDERERGPEPEYVPSEAEIEAACAALRAKKEAEAAGALRRAEGADYYPRSVRIGRRRGVVI